jgi:formate dehydrogenase maturation protein FdhE
MKIHKLELLENAIDSFNEALAKYKEGLQGNIKAYKFAILNFSHFLELLFKYYVSQSHELLIYKNPFSKHIERESTIGLWEAIQFLKNEGKTITPEFFRDLEWLKTLRNKIEHHKFEMDIPEVRRTLGRLTQALNEFNDSLGEIDLIAEGIAKENLVVFDELANEYQASLANARVEAKEDSDDEEGHPCNFCGNKDTAAKIDDVYQCRLCRESDAVVECCICGDRQRVSNSVVWNDEHAPHIDYACEACNDRISSM